MIIGMYLAIVAVMKMMVISKDTGLIETIDKLDMFSQDQVILLNTSKDPLDIMSSVCTKNPALLIMDDDYLKPNTAHILKSIKKVKHNIYVIFITSDSSIDLGREVSQLGIQFYAIKPLEGKDIKDLLCSIIESKRKKNLINN
jgi:DNA-binding NarL/FixJ family response regulator